eukprot:GFUD01075582.1.p1 GENE.GFUD01075582.1~~GFUD01075582.1.p1  ORF type:complete len:253 (+),score=95.23 GFUD01075582.1:41-799(+)
MAHCPITAPRLCHMVKSAGYDGYGFNLYQEKSRPGQFIGKIEPGSPADVAGLKEDDKIVEVNGVNIAQENHKQVVGRIKAISSETTLLVADQECEDYHTEQGIVIKSSLHYVEYISSEGFASDDEDFIDTRLQIVRVDTDEQRNVKVDNSPREGEVKEHSKPVERQDSGVSDQTTSGRSSVSSDKEPHFETDETSETNVSPAKRKDDGLDLNMSAREMREKLKLRKKVDPRREEGKRGSGDWWMQYKMIQTL